MDAPTTFYYLHELMNGMFFDGKLKPAYITMLPPEECTSKTTSPFVIHMNAHNLATIRTIKDVWALFADMLHQMTRQRLTESGKIICTENLKKAAASWLDEESGRITDNAKMQLLQELRNYHDFYLQMELDRIRTSIIPEILEEGGEDGQENFTIQEKVGKHMEL